MEEKQEPVKDLKKQEEFNITDAIVITIVIILIVLFSKVNNISLYNTGIENKESIVQLTDKVNSLEIRIKKLEENEK